MQPIVNDFFCGCGGMGVGFLNAGYKIAGAWDFDKYAVQSYDHNVGHHVKQADIKEMTWQDVPFAHVWAFGFPCQDLSVAGKQAGLLLKCQDCDSDFAIDPSNFTGQTTCPNCGSKNYKAASRSGCFYEIMRLIDETREHAPNSLPAVLVAENVKGLTPYIPVLTAELKQRGYIAHVKLYNSKFWNVAQNRERYYIAATRDDLPDVLQMPAQNEDPENVPKLSLFLDDNVPERFYIPNEKAQKIIEQALKRLETLGKVHATIPMEHWEQVVSDSQAYKQFGNAVTTTVATGVAESITDFLSHVGILKEDTAMEEMNKATSAQAQTENPAIAQITAILQPKKERLTELMNEESQLRTEVEALELAISTIQNGGKENA